jgi:hypothetical protein
MSDGAYYTKREREELEWAHAAVDPASREVHLLLAAKYAELVSRYSLNDDSSPA